MHYLHCQSIIIAENLLILKFLRFFQFASQASAQDHASILLQARGAKETVQQNSHLRSYNGVGRKSFTECISSIVGCQHYLWRLALAASRGL